MVKIERENFICPSCKERLHKVISIYYFATAFSANILLCPYCGTILKVKTSKDNIVTLKKTIRLNKLNPE